MYPIDFDKARCEVLLDCINNGMDFPVPAGGWSGTEMMRLAGTLYFAVFSQGPPQYLGDFEKLESQPEEYKEAISETLEDSMNDALEFYTILTQKVLDDEYDSLLEEHVIAAVHRSDDNEHHVQFLKGQK